jgi:hypothetical protein
MAWWARSVKSRFSALFVLVNFFDFYLTPSIFLLHNLLLLFDRPNLSSIGSSASFPATRLPGFPPFGFRLPGLSAFGFSGKEAEIDAGWRALVLQRP